MDIFLIIQNRYLNMKSMDWRRWWIEATADYAAARIALFALWPFGRTIVDKPGPRPGALVGNVIWILLCGLWLAIGHLLSAFAMAITIVGIPLALANLKLIPVSLMPLGKEIVPVDAVARV